MTATTMSLKAFVPVFGEESVGVVAATSNLYFPIAIQVPCEARSSDIMLLSAYDIVMSSFSVVSVAMAVILTVIASRIVWRAKTVRDRSPPTKTSFLSKTEEGPSSSSRKVEAIDEKCFDRTRTNSCSSDQDSNSSSGHSNDDSSVWHQRHSGDESVASSEQSLDTRSTRNSDEEDREHSGDDYCSDDAASYDSSNTSP